MFLRLYLDFSCPLWITKERKQYLILMKDMEQLLKLYLRRLTNLTGNNRSIMLRRLIADQFIDLHDLDFLYEKQSSFHLIEQLLARKEEILLSPLTDSRDSTVNIMSRRLKKLQRVNRFILDERGSQDLYVGWPFVRGQLADGTLIRCPLLFFPVDLTEDGRNWKMQLRDDVSVSLNKSFLLAYAHFNELKLPEKLYEKSFNDWDKDSRVFRTNLYRLFREEEPLEINFNQEIFIDKLISFQNFKSSELNDLTAAGELKLFPEAVLGIFPQAGSFIVPDYNSLLQDTGLKRIEDLFLSRLQRNAVQEVQAAFKSEDALHHDLDQIREETIFTPFAMDASQEEAIRAIKSGRSLVVQGPPGTGKSQLIANVIADAMAKGKKVLLVSQKKAALDVVHKRLEQKNVSDFVALVHDFKWDRKKIYEQIASQADRVPEYKSNNYGLDTIQLERKFLQASRRTEQIAEELQEFKKALFDESECGVTIKDLYLTTDRKGPNVDIRHEFKHYPLNETEPFIRKLRTYLRLSERLNAPGYPWHERLSFASWGMADQQKLSGVIYEIYPYQLKIKEKLEKVLQNEISFETAGYLLSRKELTEELLDIIKDPDVYQIFQHLTTFKQGTADMVWLIQSERSLMQCYIGDGPELSLFTNDLGGFQDILQERMAARRNAFKWITWKYFKKENSKVKRVLVLNKLRDSIRDMAVLEQKIDNRLNLEHNISQLRDRPWLLNVPETYHRAGFQQFYSQHKKALAALDIYYQVRGLGQYFNVKKLSFDELRAKLEEVYIILSDIPVTRSRWLQYLTHLQTEQLLQSEAYAEILTDALEDDFEMIVEFDRMNQELNEEEKSLFKKLTSVPGTGEEEDVVKLFINSLRLAWINHIEAKYPVLRTVTTQSFHKLEEELRQCVESKAATSQEMLLIKVREQTYQGLEYNRLNNMITYRDLRHQVGKKKKIWPLRKLLSTFSEELFQLVPCWMASPESVSAIFPMEEIFDLVIFDEASQCYVEKGIPAIYRGRQIVVTGDSMQLQPNDLYQIRWEEDEQEDLAESEIDSLLEMAGRHLMHVVLKGHYRSRAPELIEFSNHHFYGGNLQLIPEPAVSNSEKPAISFLKAEGVWEDQANLKEAEKVAELVIRLWKEEKQRALDSGHDGIPWYHTSDIGVVTFNARQQSLIQDLLEEYAIEQEIQLPGDLFVKNIENVQGDERDIIVFSIGYAPDKEGKMGMNFGSLNAVQGENRLNVAVTRARKQIYVVSSIWPHQLKTEESKNEGPKLFKAYLQYALDVSEGRYQPRPFRPRKEGFVNYLRDRLKTMTSDPAFELQERQPFADLTVLKDNKHKGVIFTDDALYYNMRSVKEIHVYRKQELENKNWSHTFIFSREYWRNPDKIKEKLNRFIHHL